MKTKTKLLKIRGAMIVIFLSLLGFASCKKEKEGAKPMYGVISVKFNVK